MSVAAAADAIKTIMKSIKEKLSLATCSLLTGASQSALAIDNAWDLDSSYLHYSEADDRVSVNKAIAKLSGDITDDDRATISLVLDTMSGATPSGTVRSKTSSVSTFTSASGASTNIGGNTSPDKVEFSDTRLAFSLDWEHNQSRLTQLVYGGSLSVENDYQSYGASVSMNMDNEDRSVTYTVGLASSYDKIFRKTGGTPAPLSNTEDNIILGDGDRYVYELIGGLSKVINKRTVGQLNLSMTYSDGYHSDPYKVISEADLVGDSDNDIFTYTEVERYFESRPVTRLRNSIYTAMAHQYGEKNEVVHLSYRYYWDDWDITAHSIDLKHRKPFGRNGYIEPHVRYHRQSAAEFFRHHLDIGEPLPEFASADYRLDEMTGLTIGLQYGRVYKGGKLRLRLEYIDQQFEDAEYNEMTALVAQVSYRKLFD